MQRTVARVAVSILLLTAVAACGDDDDDAAGTDDVEQPAGEGENTLTITEREYEFDVEGEVEAGALSIAVTNDGAEFHEIGMAKLVDGKTIDDVSAALETAGEDDEDALDGIIEEDATIDDLGGVQLPGTSYTISGTGVQPGDYVLLCFIPNAEGTPHYSLGMLTGFTVGDGEATALPDSDVTYRATDEGLEGPDAIDAGETTIEVVNDSSVNREINLLKLADGKTMDDVGAWFESGGEGAPDPATSPLGFLAFVFDAEQDRRLSVQLTPGQWAIQSSDPESPFDGPPTEDPHAILITVT